MNALPPVLPLAPPAIRLPIYPVVQGDGTLGAPIVRGSNPDLTAELSNPQSSPRPSFRLDVWRDTLLTALSAVGIYGTAQCFTAVSLHDATSGQRLLRVNTNAAVRGLGLTGVVSYDCRGEAQITYPASVPLDRQVYLAIDRGTISGRPAVIGRSAAFRLSDFVREGTTNRYVTDDRSVTERISGAAGNVGQWTNQTFNKALWAGGIAGGIVLLMLSRR